MTDVLAPPGVATGRSARTYYQTGNRKTGTLGAFTTPTWNEIAFVAGSESFDPGKENTIAGENRHSGRKYQESGVQDGASLKLTYQRPRGVADSVFAALLASRAPGGTVVELAIMDDDIAHVGAVGWRFFAKVTELTWKRDLDKFAEYDVTFEERVKYEVEVAASPAVAQELIDWTVPPSSP